MLKKIRRFAGMILSGFAMASVTMCVTCAHAPKQLKGSSQGYYRQLSNRNQGTVTSIIKKINQLSDAEQKYYYSKLEALLATSTVEQNSDEKREFVSRRKKALDQAYKRVEAKHAAMPREELRDFLTTEEEYETYGIRNWVELRANNSVAKFLVDRADPTDILVKIWIHVNGEDNVVHTIHSMEDAVEKHLSIPGFSVNLVFIGHEEPGVFTVESNLDQWITSYNWGGSPEVLAHELLHLMGLPDEYDGIASHAENKHLSIETRLWYFKNQLTRPFLPDAKDGIMCNHNSKPLHRHVCQAVGLNVEHCTNIRIKYLD